MKKAVFSASDTLYTTPRNVPMLEIASPSFSSTTPASNLDFQYDLSEALNAYHALSGEWYSSRTRLCISRFSHWYMVANNCDMRAMHYISSYILEDTDCHERACRLGLVCKAGVGRVLGILLVSHTSGKCLSRASPISFVPSILFQ